MKKDSAKQTTTVAPAKKAHLKTVKNSASYKGLEKYTEICQYYGMYRLPDIHVTKEDLIATRKFKPDASIPEVFAPLHLEEQVAILNAHSRKEITCPYPCMTFYEGRLAHIGGSHTNTDRTITIDVLGSGSPLIEVGLMHLAMILLNQEGKDDYQLELNSIGDKESMTKFSRELANYTKKNKHRAIGSAEEALPQSIHSLSEPSATHFKEVLTYLEKISVAYAINPKLLADRNTSNETSFVIRAKDAPADAPYAIATRYNSLAKKIGLKDIPAIRLTVVLPKMKLVKIKDQKEKAKKPMFYFIQLGTDAKLKSLAILEMLRKAKISVKYGLVKDKLVGQLSTAEHAETPYSLIIGQRECLENTILVRHMIDQSQETVTIAELVDYLKKIKK